MEALRAKVGAFPDKLRRDYESKLDVSWIFHDNALEGVVLSYSELKAAIDQRIISDVSLIPMYEEVKNHKLAVDFIRETARSRNPPRWTWSSSASSTPWSPRRDSQRMSLSQGKPAPPTLLP